MRALTKTLLAFVAGAFFLTSCGGDPTASNPDIKQMSDASKKALDEGSKGSCGCLKEHGSSLKELNSKLKPLIAALEKSTDQKADLDKIEELVRGTEGFKNYAKCASEAKKEQGDEAKKALQEDFKKILGDKPDFKTMKTKMQDISMAFMQKNCSAQAAILKEFTSYEEKAMEIEKKLRDKEKE